MSTIDDVNAALADMNANYPGIGIVLSLSEPLHLWTSFASINVSECEKPWRVHYVE